MMRKIKEADPIVIDFLKNIFVANQDEKAFSLKKECLKLMKKKRILRSSFRNSFVKWETRRVGGIQRPSKPSPPFS